MFLFIICVFAIFIIWGGNEQELVNAVERVIDMGRSFVEWNFPRFANATSDLWWMNYVDLWALWLLIDVEQDS